MRLGYYSYEWVVLTILGLECIWDTDKGVPGKRIGRSCWTYSAENFTTGTQRSFFSSFFSLPLLKMDQDGMGYVGLPLCLLQHI